jgi:hypothetical protein
MPLFLPFDSAAGIGRTFRVETALEHATGSGDLALDDEGEAVGREDADPLARGGLAGAVGGETRRWSAEAHGSAQKSEYNARRRQTLTDLCKKRRAASKRGRGRDGVGGERALERSLGWWLGHAWRPRAADRKKDDSSGTLPFLKADGGRPGDASVMHSSVLQSHRHLEARSEGRGQGLD